MGGLDLFSSTYIRAAQSSPAHLRPLLSAGQQRTSSMHDRAPVFFSPFFLFLFFLAGVGYSFPSRSVQTEKEMRGIRKKGTKPGAD